MDLKRLFGSLNIPINFKESSVSSERIIKLLLQSGLMLDEDMQLFFATWDNYGIIVSEDNGFSKISKRENFELIGYIVSITSVPVALYRHDIKSSLLCLLPAAGVEFTKLLRRLKIAGNEQSIRCLIQNITSLIQINKSVINYLKRRKSLSILNGTVLFNAFTKDVEQLINVTADANLRFIDLMRSTIVMLVRYMPDGEGQFLLDKSPSCFEVTPVENIEQGISLLENASDIYLLLQSALIFCLAFVFALSSWKSHPISINTIVKRVWKMNNIFKTSHRNIEMQFEQTKYSVNFRSDIQHKSERLQEHSGSLQHQIVNIKFRQAFEDCMIQLGILMEKAKFAFAKSEQLGQDIDLNELTISIEDLKSHNQELYEALEFLCNTYCILIKSERKKVAVRNENTKNEEESPDSRPSTSSHTIQSISCDDPEEEIKDEEFELYIDGNEMSICQPTYTDDIEASGATMSLLLVELKHAMLKDTRFQAARKKRGIVDDENVKSEANISRQNGLVQTSLPSDLTLDTSLLTPVQNEDDKVFKPPMLPPPLPPPMPMLPPPPPSPLNQRFLPPLQSPLPPNLQNTPIPPPAPPTTPLLPNSFNDGLGDGQHNEENLVNLAFIDKIRMASSQHKRVEDVFGESDSEDEDS